MPTPWLSWPYRLARTRWSATSFASSLGAAVGPADRHGESVQPVGLDANFAHRTLAVGHAVYSPNFSFRRARFRVDPPVNDEAVTGSDGLNRHAPDFAASDAARQRMSAPWPGPGPPWYVTAKDPSSLPGSRQPNAIFCPPRLVRLACSCSPAPRRRCWPRPCRRRSGRSRQLIELWTRQLDRIAYPYRPGRACCRPRSTPCASRRPTCARRPSAAAAFARNDLADTKKLLAPLEIKPGPDAAARDRCREGRAPAPDRAGHGQRKPGQAVRGRDRPRRPAARAPDQAARRGGAADPAAHGCLAAVAPRSGARLRPAVRRRRSDPVGGVRGLEPRRAPRRCASGEQEPAAAGGLGRWSPSPCGGSAATLRRRFGRGAAPCDAASATAPSPPPSTASGSCWCRSWPSG